MNKRLSSIGSVISLRDDLSDVIDDYFAMKMEIEDLREYKKMYNELLQASLSHSQHTMDNMMKMCLIAGDNLTSDRAKEMFPNA
jgi:hypothetical protein